MLHSSVEQSLQPEAPDGTPLSFHCGSLDLKKKMIMIRTNNGFVVLVNLTEVFKSCHLCLDFQHI